MLLNAGQLLALFPHPVLTNIVGKTTLNSITLQQSNHNGNLASVKSNLTDGLTGLMVISMKPATNGDLTKWKNLSLSVVSNTIPPYTPST